MAIRGFRNLGRSGLKVSPLCLGAMNFDNETFGKQRIMDAMQQAAELPAAAAIKHILWQMRCFTGLQRLNDDTTAVLIKAWR